MNPAKRSNLPLCLALLGGLLAACGGARDEAGKPESRAGDGRAETQGIRNTENVGYAGNAVGAKVDAALDANDDRQRNLDQQLDAAGQGN